MNYGNGNKAYYVGLDLSLAGTGLVVLNQDGEIIEQKLISTKPNKEDPQWTEKRLLKILEEVKFIPKIHKLKRLNIEGLAFGARGQAMLELAALHYFIRIYMHQKDVPYKIVPPTVIKKHITGKGNCKKELMLLKIFKKYGIEFDDNNIADAFALAKYAMEVNGGEEN